MENSSNSIVESREEFMISPNAKPIFRIAHFLKPSLSSNHQAISELTSLSLPSLPPKFDPKKWPLTVHFHGWRNPPFHWKEWVEKMASLHAPTWKKAGIFEAILNSTFEIHQNFDLFFGVAERWCPRTNSFVFPWGEATVTLEDMLIAGYSVLGSPVFEPLKTEESRVVQEDLVEERRKVLRSGGKKAKHQSWLKAFMDSGSEIEHEAFLSLWLSRFVFPTSFDIIRESVFPIAIRLARGTRIALAPAVLSTIYRDLSLLKGKIVALTTLDDDDEKVVATTFAPFQLVLVWIWERIVMLSQKPKLLKFGEPRLAQWNHKNNIVRYNTKNVRPLLDSSKESFNWRPYAKPLENWDSPKFYREKEMWMYSDSDIDDDLLSFIMCLRVSELVGPEPNCIQQYLPHRVARQFGFDQDVPGFVVQSGGSFKDAWNYYIRPVGDVIKCFIPSRSFEKDVTARYLDWWNSMEFHDHSIYVTDGLKDKKKAVTNLDGGYITLKSSKSEKTEDIYNLPVLPGLNTEKEDDIHISIDEPIADHLNQSKTFAYSSKVKIEEMNDLSVPPGFLQKCDRVEVGDSSDEDNLTIGDILKLKQKQDITTNRQRTNQNNSSPVATETCAASVTRMLKSNDYGNLTPCQSRSHSCSGAVSGIHRGQDQVAPVEAAENREDVDPENVRVELGECQSRSSSVAGNDQTPKDSEAKETTTAQNVTANAKQDDESADDCVITWSSVDNEKNKVNRYSFEAAAMKRTRSMDIHSSAVGGNHQTPNVSLVKEATMAQNVTTNAKQDDESADDCVITWSSADNEMNNINGYSFEAPSRGLEYRIEKLDKINAETKALLCGRFSGTKRTRG